MRLKAAHTQHRPTLQAFKDLVERHLTAANLNKTGTSFCCSCLLWKPEQETKWLQKMTKANTTPERAPFPDLPTEADHRKQQLTTQPLFPPSRNKLWEYLDPVLTPLVSLLETVGTLPIFSVRGFSRSLVRAPHSLRVAAFAVLLLLTGLSHLLSQLSGSAKVHSQPPTGCSVLLDTWKPQTGPQSKTANKH